jgi:hypothetical protein
MTGSGALKTFFTQNFKRVESVGLKSPEPYWTCSYYERLPANFSQQATNGWRNANSIIICLAFVVVMLVQAPWKCIKSIPNPVASLIYVLPSYIPKHKPPDCWTISRKLDASKMQLNRDRGSFIPSKVLNDTWFNTVIVVRITFAIPLEQIARLSKKCRSGLLRLLQCLSDSRTSCSLFSRSF